MSKKKYVKEETFQLRETIPIQLEDSTWKHNPYSLIIEKDFVRYESEHIKKPRISSHTLVDLSGINKFTSPGKTLLSVFGLLEKEDFDSYQAYKGGIVEVFAERYLKKEYPDAVVEAFTVSQFKDFNQFPEAAPFSGVLDLRLTLGQKVKKTVEVKSKEMKDYNWIAVEKNYPRDQVLQGANQAILDGTEDYIMLWGFITPALSKLLKGLSEKIHPVEKTDKYGVKQIVLEDSWIWGEDYRKAVEALNIKDNQVLFHKAELKADPRMVNARREKALEMYMDFYINKRIDKKLFTRSELLHLEKQKNVKNATKKQL